MMEVARWAFIVFVGMVAAGFLLSTSELKGRQRLGGALAAIGFSLAVWCALAIMVVAL